MRRLPYKLQIRPHRVFIALLFFCGLLTLFSLAAQSTLTDTYSENFDSHQDDATIDGIDFWSVKQGEPSYAITQNSIVYTDKGNALALIGTEDAANVSRGAVYGSLSPCWIEFTVRPGIGAQIRTIPTGKIAAISFDYTGRILASDASSWMDTGATFTDEKWYRVLLKLDFDSHKYDVYIEPVDEPDSEFIPDKENLGFIDSTISSLKQIGFEGAFNIERPDDTYLDDIVIYFIDRVEIITPSQSLMEGEVSNPITVQLQNSYSEPQTAWRNITLQLATSSAKGSFSLDKDNWTPISEIFIFEGDQTVTFYYKDTKVGKPILSVTEYPDRGWENALQQFKIVSEAVYFDVSVTTPHVAGENFTIEITAMDDDGEVNEFYGGEVNISARYVSPGTGTKQITPEAVSGFSQGKLEVTTAQYPDCGIIEVMVEDKDDSSKVGASGSILFIPAELSVSSETVQVVNRNFQLQISAFNAQSQFTPNYEGPIKLSVIPVLPEGTSGEVSPGIIAAEDFLHGLAEVDVLFNRWGTIKIEAEDLNYPEKKGISESIVFRPKALAVELENPPTERDFYYVGETVQIAISLIDELDAPISNYQGLINIGSTLGLSLPPEYQFTEVDEGQCIFLTGASSPGVYTVSAEDESSELQDESPEIEVKDAWLEVISTVAPVGSAEVIVRLVDEEGNIITSENDLMLLVELEEEDTNSSATSSVTHTPAQFNKGITKIVVSDTQAEIVTLSPSSEFDFKVRKGTVTFGRISKTGIGTLFWREIKE